MREKTEKPPATWQGAFRRLQLRVTELVQCVTDLLCPVGTLVLVRVLLGSSGSHRNHYVVFSEFVIVPPNHSVPVDSRH